MPRILAPRVLLTSALALNLLAAAKSAAPAIVGISVGESDGRYQASFRLQSAFDPEILSKIESGLETTFDYRLEVLRPRRLWFDERMQQRRIQSSVKYDSLTRQYGLMLRVDGEVERSSTTDKPDEMRRWMTEIRGIGLGPASSFAPPHRYAVRVKCNLQPRFILLFIPWSRDTGWVRVPLVSGLAATDASGE